MKKIWLAVFLSLITCLAPTTSQASFPCQENGLIFVSTSLSDRSTIRSMQTDGSGAVTLVNPPAGQYAFSPELSPNGQKLLYFQVDSGGNGAIYVANSDGTSPISVYTISSSISIDDVSWSPDSSRIVFDQTTVSVPSSSGIYVVSVDGSGLIHVVANTSAMNYGSPSWSPDGTKLVIDANDSVTPNNGGIMTVNVAASQTPTTILSTSTPIYYYRPDWKPDGDTIALIKFDNNTGVYTIITVDSTGGSPTNVIDNNSITPGRTIIDLDWSPDGTKLIFVHRPGIMGASDGVATVNLDGSGLVYLDGANGDGNSYPDWGVAVVCSLSASVPGLPDTPTSSQPKPNYWPVIGAFGGLGLVGLVTSLWYRYHLQR